jgi:hypothetical protein
MKIRELIENQKTFVNLFSQYGWVETTDKNKSVFYREYILNQYKATIHLKDKDKLTIKRWEISDGKKTSRGTNYLTLEQFVEEHNRALQQINNQIDISQLPNVDPNIGGTTI